LEIKVTRPATRLILEAKTLKIVPTIVNNARINMAIDMPISNDNGDV
jgi:hypothetical protein